jgi:Transposase, Mutator family
VLKRRNRTVTVRHETVGNNRSDCLLGYLGQPSGSRRNGHFVSSLGTIAFVVRPPVLWAIASATERSSADPMARGSPDLRFAQPAGRARNFRRTNLLERSLGEVRRRTKVIGRFPGETSCLSLVWAVLDLFFSHASNGATFTDLDRQHLYRIKYPPADEPASTEEVTAA